MSRIGNRLLTIPAGVEISVQTNNEVMIKGPKGTLTRTFSPLIKIEQVDQQLHITRSNENKHTKQLHGTTNSIINGMIEGVFQGYTKELEIVGVGYRAQVNGNKVNLSLGFSHPVEYLIPEGISIEAPKPTRLVITGIDKQLVGQTAADIRSYRRPEPYKGKGVKYVDEHIIRKEGKAAGK